MGFGAGWYYNDVSGDVVHASALTSVGEFLVPGWHGPYKTEALAMTHAGVKGATAHANESVAGAAGSAATNAASNVVSNSLGLPTFSNLRDLVIRSVKVILGGALIIIGLAKLSGVDKIASNLPKVVPV